MTPSKASDNPRIFRGVFKRALVAGVIGGVIYCVLLTLLRVANVPLGYYSVDEVVRMSLDLSFFGTPFGLILGAIFGVIDGTVLCVLMEIERFKPRTHRQHINLLSICSAIITAFSVMIFLSGFDVPRDQPVSTNLGLLALIAALGSYWGARDTLINVFENPPLSPSPQNS